MPTREPKESFLPPVSVVIPALDCREEVDDCIAALRAQDYPAERVQIVVADNGSTDGTPERLRALGVQTVVRKARGRSRAQNAGLEVATGEIILTTDMSCRARPDWISRVVACFDDPGVGCVAGDIRMVPDSSNMALRYQQRNNYMSPLHAFNRRRPPFLPYADGANASFRRELFDRIGGFEESFFKAADVEICYRLLIMTDYRIVFCADCLMEETGEPDLHALLHQRYRMGLGSHLLEARFPALYAEPANTPGLREHYWSFRSGLGAWFTALGQLFRGNRDALEDRLIGRLMWRAQQRGRREGAEYLRQQAQQPKPIDPAKIEAFVRRLPGELEQRVLLSTGTDHQP